MQLLFTPYLKSIYRVAKRSSQLPFYILLQETKLPPRGTKYHVGPKGTYTKPQGRLGKYIGNLLP